MNEFIRKVNHTMTAAPIYPKPRYFVVAMLEVEKAGGLSSGVSG
jgi:hypothetical protein